MVSKKNQTYNECCRKTMHGESKNSNI